MFGRRAWKVTGGSSGCWRGRRRLSTRGASFCVPLTRPDGSLDVVAAIGAFRREAIVGTAEQAQIFRH